MDGNKQVQQTHRAGSLTIIGGMTNGVIREGDRGVNGWPD